MALLAFAIAAGFGAAALRVALGRAALRPGTGLLVFAMGAGLGVALLSGVRFGGVVAGLSPPVCRIAEGALFAVAALAAVVVVALAWRSAESEEDADTRATVGGYRVAQVLLAVLVVGQLALSALSFRIASQAIPYGMWDAWGFWNARAKVLAAPGDGWKHAFDTTIPHADYPLLLPLSVVRGWDWTGNSSEEVAFALSVAFYALTALLLFAALRALRGTSTGLLAVALFLAAGAVQEPGQGLGGIGTKWSALAWGAGQYADVPLAFYYVAALACMALALERKEQSGRWLFALGLSLTAAAWAKNEGLPWAAAGVATTLFVIAVRGVPRHGFFWFAAGLLPLAVTLVAFKLGYAGPNDLVEGQAGAKPLDKLLDANRHQLIWRHVLANAPRSLLVLPIVAFVLGVRRGVGLRASLWLFAQLGAIVAAYYAVYLLTPHDLGWHLGTSIDRLILQVWPGFLFALFYAVRTPEEILTSDDGPVDESRPPGLG